MDCSICVWCYFCGYYKSNGLRFFLLLLKTHTIDNEHVDQMDDQQTAKQILVESPFHQHFSVVRIIMAPLFLAHFDLT